MSDRPEPSKWDKTLRKVGKQVWFAADIGPLPAHVMRRVSIVCDSLALLLTKGLGYDEEQGLYVGEWVHDQLQELAAILDAETVAEES
jgi:hypothetical protein